MKPNLNRSWTRPGLDLDMFGLLSYKQVAKIINISNRLEEFDKNSVSNKRVRIRVTDYNINLSLSFT